MKQHFRTFLFFTTLFCIGVQSFGQNKKDTIPVKTYQVAIFAPVYLDSVFSATGYRYGKNFPKFVLPGFDFVQGAQFALDSLDLGGNKVQAHMFDTKSKKNPVASLISSRVLDRMDLIVGSVKDREYFELAQFAAQKNIPFVSATFPNDAGVKQNPFVVIVNSTLKAHCEGIFAYLLGNHGTEKIIFVRRPGVRGDMVSEYFEELNKQEGKPLLNMEWFNVTSDDFSGIKGTLDSTRNTMVVGASLNEAFSTGLAKQLATYNKVYKTTLLGMPNWDGFDFVTRRREVIDYPIYFTTPFYISKWQPETKKIEQKYRARFKGYPSDMVYKGYEATSYFLKLINKYQGDAINHLNAPEYKVFTEYLFKPQFSEADNAVPDFFENKKLFFMKSVNGAITKAW